MKPRLDDELAKYQKQYADAAYNAAQQEKLTSSGNLFSKIVNWIIVVLTALLIAFLTYWFGWN